MAFNWQIFRTRTITAVLFAVVMVLGLCVNVWTFFILFSIIHFGCWTEYQRLMGKADETYREITPFHKYSVMIGGWCLMLWFSADSLRIGSFRLHEAGWWLGLVIVFALPLMELLFSKQIRVKNIAYSAFGLVYISLSMGFMMDLYNLAIKKLSLVLSGADLSVFLQHSYFRYGWIFPAIIIGTIWINDTMAYITGSIFGKTPLSSISPKKTWEGTIGGIILAVFCTGYVCSGLFPLITAPGIHYDISPLFWYLLAAVVAISGTVGDLLESKIKRIAAVKDSGQFMPGHGGFLDRFDSMLLAIPFAWLFIVLFF